MHIYICIRIRAGIRAYRRVFLYIMPAVAACFDRDGSTASPRFSCGLLAAQQTTGESGRYAPGAPGTYRTYSSCPAAALGDVDLDMLGEAQAIVPISIGPGPAHSKGACALGFIHQSTCPAHAGSTGHSNMLPCVRNANLPIHYNR